MRKPALRIAAMLMTARDLNMGGDLCSGANLYVGDNAITSDGNVRRKRDLTPREERAEPDVHIDGTIAQRQLVKGGAQEVPGYTRENGHTVCEAIEKNANPAESAQEHCRTYKDEAKGLYKPLRKLP